MKRTLIEPTKYIKELIKRENVGKGVVDILKFQNSIKLVDKHELINKLFNQRTAEEILKDGFVTGCTDDAIVFLALLKALGVEAVYVESLEKSWLDAPMNEQMIRGHAFVKVGELLIDPQRKVIYIDPNWIKNRYVIYAEGTEPYEFGLTGFREMVQKFMDFKESYKQNNNN
jgi:hypothetical protein